MQARLRPPSLNVYDRQNAQRDLKLASIRLLFMVINVAIQLLCVYACAATMKIIPHSADYAPTFNQINANKTYDIVLSGASPQASFGPCACLPDQI